MSLPIALHRAASAEFIEASAWYEGKRQSLGLEFIAEIDRCISLASENPLQFAVVCEDIRRVVANRFPYSVYFRAEKHRIVVLAVCILWQQRSRHLKVQSLTARLKGTSQSIEYYAVICFCICPVIRLSAHLLCNKNSQRLLGKKPNYPSKLFSSFVTRAIVIEV